MCEFGYVCVDVVGKVCLLDGIEDYVDDDGVFGFDVWMSYGDKVIEMLVGFYILVSILSCLIVVMVDDVCVYYGV